MCWVLKEKTCKAIRKERQWILIYGLLIIHSENYTATHLQKEKQHNILKDHRHSLIKVNCIYAEL